MIKCMTDDEKALETAAKVEEERIAKEKKDAEKKVEAEKKAAELEEKSILAANKKKALDQAKTSVVVFKNVFGDEIDQADYFYGKDKETGKEGNGKAPVSFNKMCGLPVDREEMIVVFNRIFKPHHNFLFYKVRDKEVYLIIVPLKFAHTIGGANESVNGDFQKHAISFIQEGSVNLDSLKSKLERVKSTIRMEE